MVMFIVLDFLLLDTWTDEGIELMDVMKYSIVLVVRIVSLIV